MRFVQIIAAIAFLIASPASAKDASAWIVTQKSGDVRVLRNGVQPASVQVRSALAPGDLVATGATGRAMLTNGDDYVIVAPSSRLVVPKEQKQTGFTRLVQQVGTMLYKVKHTGIPHFAVDTPMLAAVVKGTSFTIVVDKDRAAVQVTDGVVEVSAATGEARRLVERGATVYVGRERPDAIIELTSGTSLPASNSPDGTAVRIESSGEVPLSAISDLTGGLVRAAPTAPVAVAATSPVGTVASQPLTVAGATSPATPTLEVSTATVPTVTVDAGTVSAPSVTTAAISTPAIATPVIGTSPVSTPAVTTANISISPITVSAVTVPTVSVPTVSVTPTTITTSPIATPALTTPTVTTPEISAAIATVAPVTIPAVTVPTVTATPLVVSPTLVATPTVTVPEINTPAISTPTISTPILTVPTVTVPTATVPTVTVPTVKLPSLGLPKLL